MNLCAYCTSKPAKIKFCSSSCAAKFNLARRLPRSIESKKKTSETLKRLGIKPPALIKHGKYIYWHSCEFCCNFVKMTRHTCSKSCLIKCYSQRASERLKKSDRRNYGRGKPSYMEKSFSQWLNKLQIAYQSEVKFYNPNIKKSYFVDFLFEDYKFIIELDGTQHKFYKESDKRRDSFLSSLGYEVLRIEHRDYIKKTYETYILWRLRKDLNLHLQLHYG